MGVASIAILLDALSRVSIRRAARSPTTGRVGKRTPARSSPHALERRCRSWPGARDEPRAGPGLRRGSFTLYSDSNRSTQTEGHMAGNLNEVTDNNFQAEVI